ncbi:ubiquitin regulatory protein, putative [Hepatocystis sp. ex Piliocolobus tephrosceles]|nr:ubiquitin regulatory protein, putative [Hepatocystis sp. ex Piliocolobus tephrosceles]
MSNIRSLNDLRKDEHKKNEQESHYIGGHKSGLAVENSDDDAIPSFFSANAQENFTFITLYKNGFIIGDDGEFKDLDKEENKKFMENIQAGILPKELSGKSKTMSVAINDKSYQIYTPSSHKTEEIVYKGKGIKLRTCESNVNEEEMEKLMSNNIANNEIKEINIDNNKPITTLHIRLYNGKKITQKFNYDHTVEDLYQFVYTLTPIDFSLSYDYPLKLIERSENTLDSAKLLNIIITQKLT